MLKSLRSTLGVPVALVATIAALAELLSSACASPTHTLHEPIIYKHTITPVPTLTNAGELQLSVQPTAPTSNSTEKFALPFSISYSPIDNFGINLSGHLMNFSNDTTSDRYRYYEGALVFYMKPDERFTNGLFRNYEIIAGMGNGSVRALGDENYFYDYAGGYGTSDPLGNWTRSITMNGEFTRYFLQINTFNHIFGKSESGEKTVLSYSTLVGFGLDYIHFSNLSENSMYHVYDLEDGKRTGPSSVVYSSADHTGFSTLGWNMYGGFRFGTRFLQLETAAYTSIPFNKPPYTMDYGGLIIRLNVVVGRVWM